MINLFKKIDHRKDKNVINIQKTGTSNFLSEWFSYTRKCLWIFANMEFYFKLLNKNNIIHKSMLVESTILHTQWY